MYSSDLQAKVYISENVSESQMLFELHQSFSIDSRYFNNKNYKVLGMDIDIYADHGSDLVCEFGRLVTFPYDEFYIHAGPDNIEYAVIFTHL